MICALPQSFDVRSPEKMARSFKRKFDKKHYPVLGEDLSQPVNPDDVICLSGRRRAPKPLSVSVSEIRDLLMDPVTGKWKWPVNDADQVFPGLFLGDGSTALSLQVLRGLGITAVLNAAQGTMTEWNYVNTKASYYAKDKIRFLGVPAIDFKHYPIHQHFEESSDFIDEELRIRRGKVFVHCAQGISRSATLVIAYLMSKQNMTVQEAIETVRPKRFIAPNEGFTEQLIEYNDCLQAKRRR